MIDNLRVMSMIAMLLEIACTDFAQNSITEPILGGTTTTIAQNPWQVAIMFPDGPSLQCGGAIPTASNTIVAPTSANWIITAQHCIIHPISKLEVIAGITDITQRDQGQIKTINAVEVFPGFTDPKFGRDIALLHLSTGLDLSGPNIKAIPLISTQDVDVGATNENVIATVTGWGKLSTMGDFPGVLNTVDIPIVSNTRAAQLWGMTITSDELAAGGQGPNPNAPVGKGTCDGDSGGPLTTSINGIRKLIGIVSWGPGQCGMQGKPDMFARTSSFLSYINTHLANDRVILGLPDEFGSVNSFTHHMITVPQNTTSLTVNLYGNGTGDADLYVRQGAPPTTTEFNCRPFTSGNHETCVIDSPAPGVWYVSLRGFTAYADVSLDAIAFVPVMPGGPPCPACR